jgi:hypothetical protein
LQLPFAVAVRSCRLQLPFAVAVCSCRLQLPFAVAVCSCRLQFFGGSSVLRRAKRSRVNQWLVPLLSALSAKLGFVRTPKRRPHAHPQESRPLPAL